MAEIATSTFTDHTGQEFLIRSAHPDDAEAALAYVRGVVEETEFFIIEPDELPATVDEERAFIQDHVDNPGKILLLAEAEGHIIGNVRLEAGAFRRIAHKGNLSLAVNKEWRGRGIGTALVRVLLEWAETHPVIEKVCLEVFADNLRAIRLYKHLGFVEQGFGSKEVKRGPGHYADVLWMYRFVKQI